jgi:iron donor protein CyaY
MDLSHYKKQAADFFDRLLEQLDLYEDDIDYDFGYSKLTLRFDAKPGSVFVVNTQQAASQIWVAGEAQAWHFDWDEEKQLWYDNKNNVELISLLEDRFSQLTGKRIEL